MAMPRILVVDSNDLMLNFVSDVCNRKGYIVHRASSGKLAINIFMLHPIDVLITEILMPEMDGLELIAQVVRLSPSVKIIAYTAGVYFDAQTYLNFAKPIGASICLPRPISSEDLINSVNELLSTEEA